MPIFWAEDPAPLSREDRAWLRQQMEAHRQHAIAMQRRASEEPIIPAEGAAYLDAWFAQPTATVTRGA